MENKLVTIITIATHQGTIKEARDNAQSATGEPTKNADRSLACFQEMFGGFWRLLRQCSRPQSVPYGTPWGTRGECRMRNDECRNRQGGTLGGSAFIILHSAFEASTGSHKRPTDGAATYGTGAGLQPGAMPTAVCVGMSRLSIDGLGGAGRYVVGSRGLLVVSAVFAADWGVGCYACGLGLLAFRGWWVKLRVG